MKLRFSLMLFLTFDWPVLTHQLFKYADPAKVGGHKLHIMIVLF